MEKNLKKIFVKNTFIYKKLDFGLVLVKVSILNNPNYLLGITDKDTKIF